MGTGKEPSMIISLGAHALKRVKKNKKENNRLDAVLALSLISGLSFIKSYFLLPIGLHTKSFIGTTNVCVFV